jgi:hypothetical protein
MRNEMKMVPAAEKSVIYWIVLSNLSMICSTRKSKPEEGYDTRLKSSFA